jgi:hypothetical protein
MIFDVGSAAAQDAHRINSMAICLSLPPIDPVIAAAKAIKSRH